MSHVTPQNPASSSTGGLPVKLNASTNDTTVSPNSSNTLFFIGSGGLTITGDGPTNSLIFSGSGSSGTTLVPNGGTGRTVLTLHGLLVGEGASAVNATTAGTSGQLLIGASGADPLFSFLTSSAGTLSFVFGPGLVNIEVTSPNVSSILGISNGGTNTNTFGSTTSSVIYFDGTKLTGLPAGTTGQFLTSQGIGAAPLFQTIGSGDGITITDNSNTSVTSSSFYILGSTAAGFPITTQFSGNKLFIDLTTLPLVYGGTGLTVLTSFGVLLGEGLSSVNVTNGGTNGQVLIGSTAADPQFATITSLTGTIAFTSGPNQLSLDVAAAVPIAFGGTNQTSFGITTSSVVYFDGNKVNAVSAGTAGGLFTSQGLGLPPAFQSLGSGAGITITDNQNNSVSASSFYILGSTAVGFPITTQFSGNKLFINSAPIPASLGALGLTTLTSHGVLIGEGSNNVHVTAAGTNGQLLIGSSGADPRFSQISSSAGTLSFSLGANLLNIEVVLPNPSIPVGVAFGGTGATTFGSTASSVIYFDGTQISPVGVGTTGQFLLSQGKGVAPLFQTAGPGSLINITDNANTSVTSSVFYILGSTAAGFPITTQFTGSKLFIDLSTIPEIYGGTGRTVLTSFGVLLGEGTGSTNVTAAGTNGQLLLGSNGADPVFAQVTSSAGTINFVQGPGLLNIEVAPISSALISVSAGKTGRTILTLHGVLVGEGSASVNVTAAGTNGQVLIGSSGADPLFATLSSIGGTIAFTANANNLSIDLATPVSISYGGTNATSFGSTISSAVFFNGNKLTGLVPATSGQFLISQGPGLAPLFQASGLGDLINFTDNANNSVTASTFFILGSTAAGFPITTQFTGNKLFINLSTVSVAYGGLGRTSLTNFGVLVGEGTNSVNATSAGTNGQLLIGSTGADPLFSQVTSSAATLSFVSGIGLLNLEVVVNASAITPVARGGTGLTILTLHGVLLGEGSNNVHVTAAGTNGQVLIGATGADPAFATLSSISGTISFSIAPNHLSIDLPGAISIANGGTQATSFGSTTSSILYFDGNKLNSVSSGTAGQFLLSQGLGAPPQFLAVPTGPGISIIDNANNSVSASNFSILGSTAIGFPITTQFTGNKLVIDFPLIPATYGGTGQSILTIHGVLIGNGTNNVNVTAAGTDGQILIGANGADPMFSLLSSSAGTLTFTVGAGLLNIEVSRPNVSVPVVVSNGGTGATSYGATISSIIYFDGNKFANIASGSTGQYLISQGVGLAPQFQTIGAAGTINITDNFGNSVSSNVFSILGSTAVGFPITTQFAGTHLFINMASIPAAYGGTGRTILTNHGVLLGEGSNNIRVTAAGTNGQVLLGWNGADPIFALITSSSGTLTFVEGPGLLNIEVTNPISPVPSVPGGGTGRTILTLHGVLLGEGTNDINVTAAGTNGQVLIGSTGADPTFATLSSISGSITFVVSPNNLSIDLVIPVSIANGGTQGTSFGGGVSSGLYFTGSRLSNLSSGTLGQFLYSQGNGIAPLFQTGGVGDLINLKDNFNTSVTSSSFFLLGSTAFGSPISTQVVGTKIFINLITSPVSFGGTGRTVLTNFGVLLGEGTNGVNVTAAGTNGQLLIGATNADPAFATVASITNTISFTINANNLSIDLVGPVQVPFGGTGRTTLTIHGVLIGEGASSLQAAAIGTNGQVLIGASGADPAFAAITSISGTITFSTNGSNLSIDLISPVNVSYGGIGRTVLTLHGVILGEGASAVSTSNAATNGQILIGATGADPLFASVSSITNTITFVFNANNLSVDLKAPVPIAFGGTGVTSFGPTVSSVLYYNGTSFNAITAGSIGDALFSVGVGLPPIFQSLAAGTTVSAINLQGTVTVTPPRAVFEAGTNFAIIGPTTTAALYGILSNSTFTASSGNTYTNVYGLDLVPTIATSSSGSVTNYFGILSAGTLNLTGTGAAMANAYGLKVGGAINSDSGTSITSAYGASIVPNVTATGSGTIGTAFGTYVKLVSTASAGAPTSNAYGVFIDSTTVQNTTAAYGLYVNTPTGASVTNLSAYFASAPQFGTALALSLSGTGRTVLTLHGVLIGEGSNAIGVTAAGTNGQVLIGATGADPAFATISSISGTITFVLNANNLSIDLVAPVSIAFGGTNTTSFGNTISSVIYFNGNNLNTLTAGTSGQILASAGFGAAPFFQQAASITVSFINLQGTITVTPPTAIMQVGTNFSIIGPTTTAALYDILSNSTFTASAGNTYTSVYGLDVAPTVATSSTGSVTNYFGILSAGTLNLTGTGAAMANAYGLQVAGTMNTDSGTSITNVYGANISPSVTATGTGTVGTAFGAYVKMTTAAGAGAATSNAYGVFIDSTTVQNTTAAYGLYVNTPTGASVTNLSAYFTTAPQFGTPLAVQSGGIGRTVLTLHGVLIGEGSNGLGVAAVGTNGQVLIGATGADPAFATLSSISGTITFVLNPNNLSIDLVAPVPIAFGGTNTTSFGNTISSVIYFDGNKINRATAGTSGQFLISNGFGSAPSFKTLNGGLYWNDITGTSSGMTISSGYLADNAGLVTLTLPSTAPQSSVIAVVGFGAGGWKIAQNAGQTINFGSLSTTAGTGGSLSSTHRYDAVYFICSVTDTTFNVLNSVGNITVI